MSTEEHKMQKSAAAQAGAAAQAAAKKKPLHGYVNAKVVNPGEFEPENHYYSRVLNAVLHPMVDSFLSLGNKRIAKRYCHLHPGTEVEDVLSILNTHTQCFRWAGSDLFCTSSVDGKRQMVVIETNSCPSGQKSMPIRHESNDSAGYQFLLANTFVPSIKERDEAGTLPAGVLAVIFDKNPMEASGYAAEMATLMDEKVYQVEFFDDDPDPPARWTADGVLQIRTEEGEWLDVRAAFRYVTQKPWSRIPIVTKTLVLNPVVSCLAGGRNKMMAAKAYEFFNAETRTKGLEIRVPETKEVSKVQVPLYVKSFGGHAVVKVPYSNAGQGVYTITNQVELKAFMDLEHHYDKFIVQALIGNAHWSSITRQGQFFQTGTIPDKRGSTYVADLRMMVCSTPKGFAPVVVYARRARKPLVDKLPTEPASSSVEDISADIKKRALDSWAMLGTNLSVKKPDGTWTSESNRLMLMDRRDFNKLGISLDDLIDGYLQSVMACIAIDRISNRLLLRNTFNTDLFMSLNEDSALLSEINRCHQEHVAPKKEAEEN